LKYGPHSILSVKNGLAWCEHCEDYVDIEDVDKPCEGNEILDPDSEEEVVDEEVGDEVDDVIDDLI